MEILLSYLMPGDHIIISYHILFGKAGYVMVGIADVDLL